MLTECSTHSIHCISVYYLSHKCSDTFFDDRRSLYVAFVLRFCMRTSYFAILARCNLVILSF